MLAVLGNTLPELIPNKIIPPCNVYLSPSQELPFCDVLPPTGITTLTTVPIMGWVQIVVLIGVLETQVFIQRDARDLPGDYGTGYFGLRDKSKHWRWVNEWFNQSIRIMGEGYIKCLCLIIDLYLIKFIFTFLTNSFYKVTKIRTWKWTIGNDRIYNSNNLWIDNWWYSWFWLHDRT